MDRVSLHGLETPKQELSYEEKRELEGHLYLSENLLQLHYLKWRKKKNPKSQLTIDDIGQDFRTWFESKDGAKAMEKYALSHTADQIERFSDMDALIELYEVHQKKRLH